MTKRLGVAVLLLTLASIGAGEPIRIRGGACEVAIDSASGTLIEVRQTGEDAAIVRGGEHGLWRVLFGDGSSLDAREVSGGGMGRSVEVRHDAGRNRVELVFDSPECRVIVQVDGRDAGVDLRATVVPRKQPVLSIDLPARLRFDPASSIAWSRL